MITFSDYVVSDRTLRLAERAFTLMAYHGYDPVAYVDWYAQEGQLLKEGVIDGSIEWIGNLAGKVLSMPLQAGVGVVNAGRAALQQVGNASDKIGGEQDGKYGHGVVKQGKGTAWMLKGAEKNKQGQAWYHVGSNKPVPINPKTDAPVIQYHLAPAAQALVKDAVAKLKALTDRKWIMQDDPNLQTSLQFIANTLSQKGSVPDDYGVKNTSGIKQPVHTPDANSGNLRNDSGINERPGDDGKEIEGGDRRVEPANDTFDMDGPPMENVPDDDAAAKKKLKPGEAGIDLDDGKRKKATVDDDDDTLDGPPMENVPDEEADASKKPRKPTREEEEEEEREKLARAYGGNYSMGGFSGTGTGFDWHVRKGKTLSEHKLIEAVVNKCAKMGIDPREFASWYRYEGFFLEDQRVYEGRFGDWLGATWGGVSNWWGGEGDGTFKQGYNKKYQQYKKDSICQAAAALNKLKDVAGIMTPQDQNQGNFGGPDFATHMQTALATMDQMSKQMGGCGGPQEAPTEEAPTPAPDGQRPPGEGHEEAGEKKKVEPDDEQPDEQGGGGGEADEKANAFKKPMNEQDYQALLQQYQGDEASQAKLNSYILDIKRHITGQAGADGPTADEAMKGMPQNESMAKVEEFVKQKHDEAIGNSNPEDAKMWNFLYHHMAKTLQTPQAGDEGAMPKEQPNSMDSAQLMSKEYNMPKGMMTFLEYAKIKSNSWRQTRQLGRRRSY